MKRIAAIAFLAFFLIAGAFAQDITFLGDDFEALIDGMGQELLPSLEQLSIWNQFPGMASFPEDSNFFLTLSNGALLTGGILTFVTPDSDAFEVLDVGGLIEGILTDAGLTGATSFYNNSKQFFALPISRTAIGVRVPGDLEAMVDVAGFPQFATGLIGGWVGAESLKASLFHVGTRVRKGLLKDAGVFPALSIGVGYGYSGLTLGYDLGSISPEGADPTYGQVGLGAWELNIKGELLVQSRVHSFGLDIHTSKQFGAFVPFLGLSPYFSIASFGGNVGDNDSFAAFIDYDGGGDDTDLVYDTATYGAPNTSWVDNDVSMVLFGGVDILFGEMALQIHSSYSIGKAWPGVTLGVRWQ